METETELFVIGGRYVSEKKNANKERDRDHCHIYCKLKLKAKETVERDRARSIGRLKGSVVRADEDE